MHIKAEVGGQNYLQMSGTQEANSIYNAAIVNYSVPASSKFVEL